MSETSEGMASGDVEIVRIAGSWLFRSSLLSVVGDRWTFVIIFEGAVVRRLVSVIGDKSGFVTFGVGVGKAMFHVCWMTCLQLITRRF